MKLKSEREEAESVTEKNEDKKYERIAKIRSQELALSDKLSTLEHECNNVVLSIENIAEVIEIWTGVPATTIKENEFKLIDGLEGRLCSSALHRRN